MKIYIFTAVSLFSLVFLSCSANVEKENALNQPPVNTADNLSVNGNSPGLPNNSAPVKTLQEMEKLNREVFETKSNSSVQKTPASNAAGSNNSLSSRPAPDNSVISATTDKSGRPIEIRSFKDNPQLVKVEKVYVSVDRKIFKVYLKNGRVIELEEDRLPNFTIASVSAILIAAEAETKR